MHETKYDSESLLQKLLADYPDLLAGDQIDLEEPRRWLLVSREMAVPGEEDGAGRWSLDHLFLDQDAIPTLVEVKRSGDTRIRREVVGQMLDYAANAVVYWPVEAIRSQFEKTTELLSLDPVITLNSFLGDKGNADAFWQAVKTNLQAGKIRLVFVADEIPQELRRVIEFLNGQMDPAEVLAIEVKQYVGQGDVTLVPRLIGQTTAAQQRKSNAPSKQQKIDETTFLQEVLSSRGTAELEIVKRLIGWSKDEGFLPNFNKWQKTASFIPVVDVGGRPRYPISVQSGGDIWIQMRWLRDNSPFNREEHRVELLKMLNAIPGVSVPPERITGYPCISLQTFLNDASLYAFLNVMTWLVQQLRAANAENV